MGYSKSAEVSQLLGTVRELRGQTKEGILNLHDTPIFLDEKERKEVVAQLKRDGTHVQLQHNGDAVYGLTWKHKAAPKVKKQPVGLDI
jgi:hypothetical protein